MAKAKKPATPYWNEMVHLWFEFCRNKFGEEPVFVGSAPRNLKNIVSAIKDRAEKKGIEWTLPTALHRVNAFLNFAFEDNWLRRNWMLHIIDRQKEKIFFNATAGQVSHSEER